MPEIELVDNSARQSARSNNQHRTYEVARLNDGIETAPQDDEYRTMGALGKRKPGNMIYLQEENEEKSLSGKATSHEE